MKKQGKMSKWIYKITKVFFVITILICLLPISNSKASDPSHRLSQERILNFHSTITIKKDSSLDIIEEITVNALHYSINHGIYRDFPTKYYGQFGLREQVGFRVLEIQKQYLDDNGSYLQHEPYFTESLNNGTRVYIGDKDTIIPTGLYKYIIHYETTYQLADLSNSDQLYYNVTGNGWEFPIDKASADIVLPGTFSKSSLTINGYEGPVGSTQETVDYSVSNSSNSTKVSIQDDMLLLAQEGFTVKVNFPKGKINYPIGYTGPIRLLKDNLDIFSLGLGALTLAIFCFITWRKFGIDPNEKPVIPLFEEPKDFTPAGINYLKNKKFDSKALSAAIINLGVKGYLKISEVEDKILVFTSKHFQLEKLKEPDDTLPIEEKQILNKLFATGNTYDLKKSYDTTMHDLVTSFSETIKVHYFDNYYKPNYVYVFLAAFIGIIFFGLSFFISAQDIYSYLISCIIFGIVTFFGFILFALFFKYKNIALRLVLATIYVFILFVGLIALFGYRPYSIYPGLTLSVIVTIFILYFFLIQRPTEKGSVKIAEIEGFKMYLGTAEAEDLKVTNKEPPKTLDLFQKYLPYAIALSVETVWTKKFDEQIKKAQIDGNSNFGTWYVGSSAFNSASSISSFTSSISSSISSASTSSSSSGSSGGGGGGGGGGGW